MSKWFKYLTVFLALLVLSLGLLSGSVQARQAAQVPQAPEDFFYGEWQEAPTSGFAYTRFDAEYSYDTGKVYFLGGRLADSNTDGSVWEYDPGTGVYSDTGVDMPVPISNYQIANVTNGAGDEVFMLFGGRPAAGGVTNTVQGYIPSSNSTVDFTATDPYPLSTSPGGVVVVDNIAYSFGGFDAVAVTDATYLFDITASDGNRFTAGPPLNLGRSYIAATVVDGYIYAIGGDTFDGTALYAQTIAERLDAGNPVAWDDAGVADMPIACDENQAFGFDSDAAYDLAGAIVLGGCGQWSSEIAESMIYDVAADTWDADYPDLNQARRNHAGAFIPTGDGTNGLPGMWVWGGIQGGDANVLTIPEYNQVTPLDDFTLVPQDQYRGGFGNVAVNMGAANRSGGDDVFDLSYDDTQGWDITGPATIAVDDGDLNLFTFEVEIPSSAQCEDSTVVTVDAVGQSNTSLMDSATATVQYVCETGIFGTIYDANTALEVPGAYIYIELTSNPDVWAETFADSNGDYSFVDLTPGDYYLSVSAEGYEWSALPEGFPAGADVVTVVSSEVTFHDVSLNAPIMDWSRNMYDVQAAPGEVKERVLTISNDGTSDLFVAIGNYDEGVTPPPNALPRMMPEHRVDPQILAELDLDGATDFIVFMAEEADLSAAYSITDWDARGQYVYDRLFETAQRTQAGVTNMLAAEGLSYRSFLASNSVMVYDGTLAELNTLAARPDVAFITANNVVELFDPVMDAPADSPEALTWGVMAVNADDVWTTYSDTGTGVVVANVDSGVEWTHPALMEQYRGGVGDHDYNWYMPTSGCPGELEPCDNNGHGTHTMGTMVGSTDPADPVNAAEGIGVAPGAEWIACKGCETNGCSWEALLTCGDWIAAPWDLDGMNPDPSERPHIVNNSWGGGGGDFWYGGVVGAWRAAGIFPQFSAGNSGPNCSTTGSPGDYDQSFGAAAISEDLVIAGFSSRGPAVITGILQPNISAPGVDVRSSVPGNTYASFQGTSMASPHVAGTVALIWSYQPDLIGQIEDTAWLLSQSATPLYTEQGCGGDTGTSHPNHTFGYGLVDALRAVENSDGIVIPWLVVDPIGVTIPPGGEADINLTFTAPDMVGVYEGTLQLTADEPYNPDVRISLRLTVERPTDVALSEFGSVNNAVLLPAILLALAVPLLLLGLIRRRTNS